MAKVFNKNTIEYIEDFDVNGIKHCKFKIDFVAINEHNTIVHIEPVYFILSEGLIIEDVSPSLEINEWRHFIGTIADAKESLINGFNIQKEETEEIVWGVRSNKIGAEVIWQDANYSLETYKGNYGQRLYTLVGDDVEDFPVYVKSEERVIYEHASEIPDVVKLNIKKAFKDNV